MSQKDDVYQSDDYYYKTDSKNSEVNASKSTDDEKKQDEDKTAVTAPKSGESETATTETKTSKLGNAAAGNTASTPVVAAKGSTSTSDKPSEEITIIAKGTKIVGDISADGGLRVGGEIKGNIHVVGKLELNGKVIGDIEAEDITISTSMVKGNVAARSSITIDKETTVAGDVSARNAEFDGRIKGNMTVKERAHIQTDSVLLGNLTSGIVNIEEGAMLRGDILITDSQGNEVNIDELDFDIVF